MKTTVKTSGTADQQAGQIVNAIEISNVNIIPVDDSYDHEFGLEVIIGYEIEEPEVYVTVESEGLCKLWMDIYDEFEGSLPEFNIDRHTVTVEMMKMQLSSDTKIYIEFELHLKEV